MAVRHEPYRVSRTLNERKQTDDWFRDRYSVIPYVGCEYARHYSNCRARRCCLFDDPADVGRILRVKVNSPQ